MNYPILHHNILFFIPVLLHLSGFVAIYLCLKSHTSDLWRMDYCCLDFCSALSQYALGSGEISIPFAKNVSEKWEMLLSERKGHIAASYRNRTDGSSCILSSIKPDLSIHQYLHSNNMNNDNHEVIRYILKNVTSSS